MWNFSVCTVVENVFWCYDIFGLANVGFNCTYSLVFIGVYFGSLSFLYTFKIILKDALDFSSHVCKFEWHG